MQALPLLAVAAPLIGGIGGLAAGEADRDAAYAQASEEERAAAAKERRVRVDARRAIGEQAAALAGGGFMGASAGGTAADALRESQIEAALDVLELRREGMMKGRALRAQGDARRREGRFALLEGMLGAGSKYLGQKADWAAAKVGA